MATKRTKHPKDRVWIELEKPRDAKHAEQICKAANNLLRRMCARADVGDASISKFWWSKDEQHYCYGGVGGYSVQIDRGVWLNLDYVGRPLTAEEDAACAPLWGG